MQAEKCPIRRQIRAARKSLPAPYRTAAQKSANNHLKKFIKRGKRIAVYWAIGSELDVSDFIATAQKRGAIVYLPYIELRSLKLWFTPFPISGSLKQERKRGTAKLHVPQWQGRKIRAAQLQQMILPIVGIDANGYRLGQGGGYYDCTLGSVSGSLKPTTIAAGFACQSVEKLPRLPHDISTDYFVCEHGVRHFSRGK